MKKIYSIVETDNFGSDYPDESFVIRHLTKNSAEVIADIINIEHGKDTPRYYKVVEDSYDKPYELKPGFEP